MKSELGVEEEHPLKQGLKQVVGTATYWADFVEEEHPLKQGLKHFILRFNISLLLC